jgi:uncharacterized membrane protein
MKKGIIIISVIIVGIMVAMYFKKTQDDKKNG